MSGWIKLHRKMLDWEWYDDPNTFRLFMTLLMLANHSDKKWRGNLIKKGSLLTSIQSLSVKTGLSYQQIRTSLGKLISTGEITNKSSSKNRIITISNWESHQEDNKQKSNTLTINQQTSNKQVTTNKNVKNDREDKDINLALPKKYSQEGRNLKGYDFSCWPAPPSDDVLNDFKKTRKSRFTQTAVVRMAKEIHKAYENGLTPDDCLSVCCEAGWQGFKYEWYLNREKQDGKKPKTFADKDYNEGAEIFGGRS